MRGLACFAHRLPTNRGASPGYSHQCQSVCRHAMRCCAGQWQTRPCSPEPTPPYLPPPRARGEVEEVGFSDAVVPAEVSRGTIGWLLVWAAEAWCCDVAAATRLSTACRMDSVAFVMAVCTIEFTSRAVISSCGEAELRETSAAVGVDWLVGVWVTDVRPDDSNVADVGCPSISSQLHASIQRLPPGAKPAYQW